MQAPEPKSVTFPTLIGQIEQGSVKIPQFQREFVWKRQQSAKLIDSILKGYPIGTFIFWKTVERLRSIRNLGGIELPKPPDGDRISYVLDGQQRLTSLFVSLKALQVTLDDEIRDYAQMQIDLLADESDTVVTIETVDNSDKRFILLSELLEGDFEYLASYPRPQRDRIKIYKNRIESYQFSIVEVADAPIEVATEIFTRLNIGGRALTVFEIMVAKTYDHDREFDLTEKVGNLDAKLIESDFGAIPHATVLQVIAACLAKDSSSKSILSLPKVEIIENWERLERAIIRAIEHLRIELRVVVAALLPFPGLVIAFAYFFYKADVERPDPTQRKLLRDFFWRVSLGGRYSSSLESRSNRDLAKIDSFIEGKPATYEWPVDITPYFIEQNGWFSTSRSFIKALLCLLAAQDPRSFNSNAPVTIRNNWLSRANSKNYHHFFPKSYMEKHQSGIDYGKVNHIANITFVDDYLNKQVIRARPPSEYLRRFKEQDPELDMDSIFRSHLIILDAAGVENNDFEQFFRDRCIALSRTLSPFLIPQEVDRREAAAIVAEDDSEEISGQ